MTRPDGLIFAIGPPLVLLITHGRAARREIFLYGLTLGLMLTLLFGSRWLIFGDIFPNTYYAKGGPSIEVIVGLLLLRPIAWERLLALYGAIAGPFSGWLLLATTVSLGSVLLDKALKRSEVVLLVFCGLACAQFLLLPPDWMDESRFATAFCMLALPMQVWLAIRVMGKVLPSRHIQRRWVVGLFGRKT